MVEVWPVIHAESYAQVHACALTAARCGCAGVFLIDMKGGDPRDVDALSLAAYRAAGSALKIGVNYLHATFLAAVERAALTFGHQAIWSDDSEITIGRPSGFAVAAAGMAKAASLPVFAGIAHKGGYPYDVDPGASAVAAHGLGFIPTTTGLGTGIAPTREKLAQIRSALGAGPPLAIASGVTPENAAEIALYATHLLVNTGILSDGGKTFDEGKLVALMRSVGYQQKADGSK